MNFIHRFTIKTTFLLLFFFFLCVPFILFGVIWYKEATRTVENNAYQAGEQLVEQLSTKLDIYFNELERATLPLATHPLIQEFLKIHPSSEYNRYQNSKLVGTQILDTILFGRKDLHGVSLYSALGNVASTTANYANQSRFGSYMEQGGDRKKFRFFGISVIDNAPVLTVGRNLYVTNTMQLSGILTIDLKLIELHTMAQSVQISKTGFVWIVDNGGRLIYHPERDRWGQPLSDAEMSQLIPGEGQFLTKKSEDQQHLISSFRSTSTGWTVVFQIPIKALTGDMVLLRNMTVTIGICLIIIALVTVGGYSLFLSRSLSQLRYMMKRAELGDLSVMAPSHKNQEINSLYHSFNKMVEEIRGLIEVVHTSKIKEKQMEIKQRESMLASIQSKINPHFLYNTLEVINSHAITEGYMPISRMVIALAKIFRYSVGSPQEIINVQVELDQIQTYLEVQKQRFEELNMEINIEYGTRKQVKALKLLLQPIVENAFIHGYEKHKIEPSYIGVFDELRDDCYVIKVVDKGGGMSAGKVEQFNHIFNEVTINQIVDDYQHPFLDRIGLWNVHSRIVLAFGNPYGLHIAKSDESGTVIEIRFPYE